MSLFKYLMTTSDSDDDMDVLIYFNFIAAQNTEIGMNEYFI